MNINDNEIVYAPIIIPTLNRIDHLERCINSLRNNTWAKYTELFISVDYPPNEKYQDGYAKVCQYLDKGISGFRSCHVTYQSKNLGSIENSFFLRKWVSDKYPVFIYTEDDNEFSSNFIEFIDKGLAYFKNDKNILGICSTGLYGYTETANNILKTHNFSAYGYGAYIDEYMWQQKNLGKNYIVNCCKKLSNLLKVSHRDPALIFSIQDALIKRKAFYNLPNGEIPVIDMFIKVYMYLEDKYVICPTMPLSRNWGYDGSGENCTDIISGPTFSEISNDKSFEYNVIEDIKENHCNASKNIRNCVISDITAVMIYIWAKIKNI